MQPGSGHDRVWTLPNVISLVRLALVGVLVYTMLITRADGLALAVLVFSGVSDWADGKIARLLSQSSRLGELLDPAVDRLYMVAVPLLFGLRGLVPWWIVIVLLARDALLAAALPVLRGRGLIGLPVTYVGKAGTFTLMSGFPLVLLGQFDTAYGPAALAFGWAFLIWGLFIYLWSFGLYAAQLRMVLRQPGRVGDG